MTTDRGPENRPTFLGNLSQEILRQSLEREEGHPVCPEAGWAGAFQRRQRVPTGLHAWHRQDFAVGSANHRSTSKFQMGEGMGGFQAPQTVIFGMEIC